MRRRGKARHSTLELQYPFRAMMQMHFHRISSEVNAEQAAAAAISNGNYRTGSTRIDNGVVYLFASPDHAHAMQIWMEAHARVYEPWIERLESYESSCRAMAETNGMVNAAAATGALDRLRYVWTTESGAAAVELLREIEPGFSKMDAVRAIDLMVFARHR